MEETAGVATEVATVTDGDAAEAAATSDASTARRETTPSSDMTGEELLRTAAAGCGASIMLGPWKEADALKRDSICLVNKAYFCRKSWPGRARSASLL